METLKETPKDFTDIESGFKLFSENRIRIRPKYVPGSDIRNRVPHGPLHRLNWPLKRILRKPNPKIIDGPVTWPKIAYLKKIMDFFTLI